MVKHLCIAKTPSMLKPDNFGTSVLGLLAVYMSTDNTSSSTDNTSSSNVRLFRQSVMFKFDFS